MPFETPHLRILLLVHGFNSLAQRFFVELAAWGHAVSVEYDIHDAVTLEAIHLFQPDLIIAPYLKRILPASIYERLPCWIVHPGVVGDRGPASLDRAILAAEREWGVTILQATSEVDGGPVIAERRFMMRDTAKSSLYRYEVTEAAILALRDALMRWPGPDAQDLPRSAASSATPWRGVLPQSERAIDWHHDDTATVLRKIRCADAHPGLNSTIMGIPVKLYGAHREGRLSGAPGTPLARRGGALCLGTTDQAVWVTHLARIPEETSSIPFKLSAVQLIGPERLAGVPEDPAGFAGITAYETYQDIYYTLNEEVGFLHYATRGGALASGDCARLIAAYRELCALPGLRVLVLCGGEDFWLNGIDLHAIEAAASPADASWQNIHALNDFVREVIGTTSHVTIAALAGAAAAGGAFAALACDEVWARAGIVLNPHYKNMGNLYGSEYWTYLLAKKIPEQQQRDEVLRLRVPIGAAEALRLGLVDRVLAGERTLFQDQVLAAARAIARGDGFAARLMAKAQRRMDDEKRKPLEAYRAEELARMQLNFYGMDPSYHKARYNFVHRVPLSRTPRHLARHRDPSFRPPDLRSKA